MEIRKAIISESKTNTLKKERSIFVQQGTQTLRSENISLFHSHKGEKLQDLILGKNWYAILTLERQESHLKFKSPQHIS